MTSRFDMNEDNTLKVIHIMNHPPDYESYANKPRPPVNWDTPEGSWVGIWGYDWADLLGKNIMLQDPRIRYEVWQPELRARKIYSHTFEEGWTHKQFPAQTKTFYNGLKKSEYIISPQLPDLIENSLDGETMFILPMPNSFLIRAVIERFKDRKILCNCLGDLTLPLLHFWKFKKNIFSKINSIHNHFAYKRVLPYIDGVSLINHNRLEKFQTLYDGRLWIVPMGVDFDFWKPLDKIKCRGLLNLPEDKMILFSASRLNDLKQVAKTIDILNKLSGQFDFLYIVSGHGTRDYEDYLRAKAEPLLQKDMIRFTGYVTDDDLLNYYNASDVFLLTSLSEGSPVSVQKAFACDVPVFSTNVGYTAELMQKYHVGTIVPRTDYASWEVSLEGILHGNIPEIYGREKASTVFSWPNVAQKFIHILNTL